MPDEGDVIEGEAIAAPDRPSQDTGGVAITNAQSGQRRRPYARYPGGSYLEAVRRRLAAGFPVRLLTDADRSPVGSPITRVREPDPGPTNVFRDACGTEAT
jgi:hypothetical protein